MWEDYKPLKKERDAIDRAYRSIVESAERSHEIVSCMAGERKGYGNKNDAIPTIGAKALCVKWFYEGFNNPEILARKIYNNRPSAAWLIGYGAACATNKTIAFDNSIFDAAISAHEATFNRMVNKEA